jgi:hypothetical protein
MAKQIKCPTCGTIIPIPGEITGQVVKCPGCGKGLKLVPKKAPGSPATTAAQPRTPSESAGGMTVKSFAGEPALHDEPPVLDIPCAACGKSFPESDLIEDRGELICSNCLGERQSRGPKMAPEVIDFAEPPAVIRRGKPITLGPLFIAAAACVLIWAGTSVYLNLFAKPVGKPNAVAIAPKSHPAPPAPSASQPDSSTQPVALAPDNKSQPAAATNSVPSPDSSTKPVEPQTLTSAADWEKQNGMKFYKLLSDARGAKAAGRREQAEDFYKQAFALVEGHDVPGAIATEVRDAQAELEQMKSAAAAAPSSTEPVAIAPQNASTAPVASTQAIMSTDPLQVGIQKLKEGDYRAARDRLEIKRGPLMRTVGPTDTLTDDQKLCLSALAAAYIGMGKPELGAGAADRVFRTGDRSRATVLNTVQIHLAGLIRVDELVGMGEVVQQYMQGHPDDELASNVLGTVIDRGVKMIPTMTPEQKSKYDGFKTYLDQYNTQLATKSHPGMAKWGTEWLPEADVKRYMTMKQAGNTSDGMKVARQLDAARKNLAQLQNELDLAARSGAPSDALRKRVDDSNAQVKTLETQAHAGYYPPHWLDKFEPVLPDGI